MDDLYLSTVWQFVKVVFSIVAFMLFGVFILAFKYPKVLLPLLLGIGVIYLLTGMS